MGKVGDEQPITINNIIIIYNKNQLLRRITTIKIDVKTSSSAKQPLMMLCSSKVGGLYSLPRKSPYQNSPWPQSTSYF